MPELERVSIAIDTALIDQFDAVIGRDGKSNRSEAIRSLIRNRLVEEQLASGGELIATVSLVYDPNQCECGGRSLVSSERLRHVVLASMLVHLEEVHCLEVIVLRGRAPEVQEVTGRMLGTPGIKHGRVVLTSTQS